MQKSNEWALVMSEIISGFAGGSNTVMVAALVAASFHSDIVIAQH